jgi:hypothetical protein
MSPSDDRPSILDRWRKNAELPEREPEAERKAKAFTEAVMRRIHAQMDSRTLPVVRFEGDPEAMAIAVNAAKWFLPAALREFFDFDGKKKALRALRKEVQGDPTIPIAERNSKIRALERRIAGLNQFELGFDALMSFGTHNAEAHKDDEDTMSKVASSFVSLLPLAAEARRYLGIHLWVQEADGSERDISGELKLS